MQFLLSLFVFPEDCVLILYKNVFLSAKSIKPVLPARPSQAQKSQNNPEIVLGFLNKIKVLKYLKDFHQYQNVCSQNNKIELYIDRLKIMCSVPSIGPLLAW